MKAHNRRGGRKAIIDIETPALTMLASEPHFARDIAAAIGVPTKAVTATLHRLKARGKVKIVDGSDRWSSKAWALSLNATGFELGDCWPMPVDFPPLPVPGTVTTHERAN